MHSHTGIPWDRLPGESAPAYEAFATYRDAGPQRSVRGIGRHIGKSSSLLFRWSTRYAWTSRCQAFDSSNELAAQAREDDPARRAYLLRHLEAATIVQLAPSAELARRLEENPELYQDLEFLILDDLARKNIGPLLRVMKLERELAGFTDAKLAAAADVSPTRKGAEEMTREEAEAYLLGDMAETRRGRTHRDR